MCSNRLKGLLAAECHNNLVEAWVLKTQQFVLKKQRLVRNSNHLYLTTFPHNISLNTTKAF